MKLDFSVCDVTLESPEEGEKIFAGSEYKVVKSNGIADQLSVEDRIPNVAMLEIGDGGNLLVAVGTDKAKVNRGCGL